MITYPNGKIYIGQDVKELFMTYFGSSDEEYIQRDFIWNQITDFTIRKQILWSSQDASEEEITIKETEYILKFHSNDSNIGYNQRVPKT